MVNGLRAARAPEVGERLLRELAALRVELRPGGAERIEAETGLDDLPDSLMIAAGPWRDRGRVRLVLADLAAQPIAEAPVPELDEPVVETGGGLRLYRRPPLQSVGGPELTMPAGVSPVGDRRRRDFRAAVLAAENPDREERTRATR